MVEKNAQEGPDHTAVRVALWRALHVAVDQKPHVFSDEIGEKIISEADWQLRPDMDPGFSKNMRASIVGRARFVEDLLEERVQRGASQYVILGAGLDTFAQRRPELGSRLQVFEVDQPGVQAWKKRRLREIGYDIPGWAHFIPIDFAAGMQWWEQLVAGGLETSKPTVFASTGVSMYLSHDANLATFRHIAQLAPGSVFAMTFLLSTDHLGPQERSMMEFVMKRAAESGTPFRSLYSPKELVNVALKAGFKKATCVSGEDIYQRYFASRHDGLNPGTAEAFLVAET